jgi:hypothetical protein
MKGVVARRPNDDGVSPALDATGSVEVLAAGSPAATAPFFWPDDADGSETRAPHSGNKPLEREDPFELIGTGYPVANPEETDRITARCIVEEYALTGFSAAEILVLFQSPVYAHSHAIYQRRGAELVRDLIGEVFGGAR